MLEILRSCLRRIMGIEAVEESYFDCHHNFVRHERHEQAALWVHRKGAMSACDDELGIVPGSMGSASFHVRGRGGKESMRSSSHGAGRVMSRTEARRRITARAFAHQMRGVWFDPRLTSRLVEEAPTAYEEIGAVMRAQRELTRIERRLVPLLSYKGD